MKIIDLNNFRNNGTNGPTRSGFSKVNTNSLYIDAAIEATRSLCGFNRESTETIGVLQYCHDASSGIVENIEADGTYSRLTSQSFFADGETEIADRTLVQYHSSDQQLFSYWYQGVFIEISGIKTVQLPDDNNANYIEYSSDGELVVVTNPASAIVSGTLVSLVLSNSTSGKNLWFADERHGIVMDGQTHLNMHMTRKFSWVNNCDIEGLAENGVTFSNITEGRCGDEDIPMVIDDISTAPFLYVDAAGNWDISETDNNKLAHFVGAKVVYNPISEGLGSLTEIDADYICMAILATNNKIHPYVKLVGQELYTNRSEAREHLYSALHEIEDAGLPTNECRPIGSFIIHNEATGQIEKGDNGEIWIDHRRGYPVARF